MKFSTGFNIFITVITIILSPNMSPDLLFSDMSLQSSHADFVSGILSDKRIHYVYKDSKKLQNVTGFE